MQPVSLDPIFGAPQRFGAELDLMKASVLRATNEPRAFEHAQMPGDGGRRNAEWSRQPPDVGMTAHESLQNASASGIGERRKNGVE